MGCRFPQLIVCIVAQPAGIRSTVIHRMEQHMIRDSAAILPVHLSVQFMPAVFAAQLEFALRCSIVYAGGTGHGFHRNGVLALLILLIDGHAVLLPVYFDVIIFLRCRLTRLRVQKCSQHHGQNQHPGSNFSS